MLEKENQPISNYETFLDNSIVTKPCQFRNSQCTVISDISSDEQPWPHPSDTIVDLTDKPSSPVYLVSGSSDNDLTCLSTKPIRREEIVLSSEADDSPGIYFRITSIIIGFIYTLNIMLILVS